MTLVLLWLALFGVWPLAHPEHNTFSDPMTWLDLALHFGAAWLLIDRAIEDRARKRAGVVPPEEGP